MLTVDDLSTNRTIRDFANFGLAETPVYANVGGKLFEIGEITEAQIKTPSGPHDVVVVAVSDKQVEEF